MTWPSTSASRDTPRWRLPTTPPAYNPKGGGATRCCTVQVRSPSSVCVCVCVCVRARARLRMRVYVAYNYACICSI